MNRFVLHVDYSEIEEPDAFVPFLTNLSRAELEGRLFEAAEEALGGARRGGPDPIRVRDTNIQFFHWSLVKDGRVSPPRVMTVDEWFFEFNET